MNLLDFDVGTVLLLATSRRAMVNVAKMAQRGGEGAGMLWPSKQSGMRENKIQKSVE